MVLSGSRFCISQHYPPNTTPLPCTHPPNTIPTPCTHPSPTLPIPHMVVLGGWGRDGGTVLGEWGWGWVHSVWVGYRCTVWGWCWEGGAGMCAQCGGGVGRVGLGWVHSVEAVPFSSMLKTQQIPRDHSISIIHTFLVAVYCTGEIIMKHEFPGEYVLWS